MNSVENSTFFYTRRSGFRCTYRSDLEHCTAAVRGLWIMLAMEPTSFQTKCSEEVARSVLVRSLSSLG